MLEARHLRIVRAIGDTGSLTKAAVVLGLTQPALTHQLHRMERLFGGALFVRDRRGARPTTLGMHVIERARFVLPAAGALEMAILAEYPTLPMPRPAEVVVHEVAIEPLFVALASIHRLADRDEVELAELAEESWTLPDDADVRGAEYLRQVCDQVGMTPKIAYRVTSQVARDLISRSLAIGLFQPTAPASDGVVFRPLRGSPAELRHIIAVRAGSPVARYGAELAEAARIS